MDWKRSLTDGDCDDLDGSVYSNAPELCDGQYNDCTDAAYDASSAPMTRWTMTEIPKWSARVG